MNTTATLVTNEEHAALGSLFRSNQIHGRRGMSDLPQAPKLHLVDVADGNRQHPVAASIKAGHPKPSAPPTHIHGLIIGRRLMVA